METCAPSIGPTTNHACSACCGFTMGKGFRLEPAHNPHGLRDVIPRYFAGEIAA